VAARRVLDRYDAAGGGLLAGGLAYAALFAMVPGVLLTAGIAGALVQDPTSRAELVRTIARVMPPLRGFIDVVMSDASTASAPVSIVGLVALAWGASRFVVAFQEAIARVMGADRKRGLVVANLGAFGAVLLMVAVLFVGTAVAGLLAFLEAGVAVGAVAVLGDALHIVLGLAPSIAAVVAVALVYRFVPETAPRWSALGPPALVIGLTIALLAQAFVFLAPRLIGSAALLGTIATVFAALAWLGLTFQALLLGAAWVRDRGDRLVPAGAGPIEQAVPHGRPDARR